MSVVPSPDPSNQGVIEHVEKIRSTGTMCELGGVALENLHLAIVHLLKLALKDKTIPQMELVNFELVQFMQDGAIKKNIFHHIQVFAFKDGDGNVHQGTISIKLNRALSEVDIAILMCHSSLCFKPDLTITVDYDESYLGRLKSKVNFNYEARPIVESDVKAVADLVHSNLLNFMHQ